MSLGLLGDAAEEVAAADHDGDLDAQAMHLGDFGRDFVDTRVVDAKTLSGGQRLTGDFQQNAFVNRSAPCLADT